MRYRTFVLAIVCALVPAIGLPQALPSLSSLRVGYNTRKATVRPDGVLKAQIDAIDRELADATRLGRTGEVRRLLAKGTTLLSGREWTSELDFSTSLVLRSDRVVVDSSRPYTVRLEQIYSPAATLRRRPVPTAGNNAAQPGEVVKNLGTFEGLSRDLRESPFFLDLALTGVPDGDYQLVVEVLDGSRPIGTVGLLVHSRQGLDALVARLEEGAARAPEAVRADVLYPVDRMRQVNRGRLELRTFAPDRDLSSAEAVLAASASGKNPFDGRTGDFKRHYTLESANEIMPYRLYVPTSYTPAKPFPLIVALHGLGGTEDSFFTGYNGVMPTLAEARGYIVAAPLGYRVDGSYGWGLGTPPPDPNTRRVQERSEEDVMQVLRRVRAQYNVDPGRIYLMGHSMGAIGTWKIAPKYPDIWAALGAFAGSGAPATLDRVRRIPQFVVHGDDDRTVSVEGSRAMVAKMKELGVEVRYLEIPGGGHSDVVAPNIPGMFDFFDAHKKPAATSP
jgi:poly(3-hydroxybutyrate) depolymerase